MRKYLWTLATGAVVAIPAAASDITGDWRIEENLRGTTQAILACTLKEADHKLTGVCRNEQQSLLNLTGEINGNKASWSYTVSFQGQDLAVDYSATLESATDMVGSISVSGIPAGGFTGRKR